MARTHTVETQAPGATARVEDVAAFLRALGKRWETQARGMPSEDRAEMRAWGAAANRAAHEIEAASRDGRLA